jgi:hypothetical protein
VVLKPRVFVVIKIVLKRLREERRLDELEHRQILRH